MDFGERLAAKIKADVERQIEASLTGGTHVAEKPKAGGMALTGLALAGLVVLVLLVAAVVAIVLLLVAVL